ncbi:MAG: TonB-dependent receptor [Gammaproteobacteria bacterium SHHR-1]|uniref:TonB-dependent receptor plug domain-containing protein n=1 Tax=Magnetovirga frankeli TaxID=947516 RepID=UPI0012937E83|nr:TonB-dependent receptor [gamma proteobacterium SS-5]
MNHTPVTLLLLASLSGPALANTGNLDQLLSMDLEQLMQVKVSISSVTPQPIAKAPSVVSAITAEDIKATGATNLIQVLESVPGVHIRYSGFGNRPLIHFRGASANQTLLMVNGRPMKDLVWGYGIFWKGLPASIIERVEVLRGPGSALFGADASAGAINVITKTAAPITRAEAGLRLGSFDSQQAWGQFGGQVGGYELGLTADVSSTAGHDPLILRDANGASGIAPYGWDNMDLRLSLARGHWRLLADYMRHDNLETGLAGRGVLDELTSAEDERLSLDLLYDNPHFSRHWGLKFKLGGQQLSYDSGSGFREQPPSLLYPQGELNQMASAERQLGFDLSGRYSGLADHSITLGLGFSQQDLYRVEQWVNAGTGPDGLPLPVGSPLVELSDSPYAFAPERSREIRYLLVQDEWQLAKDWQATLGARYDQYSDFGGTFNPRLALVWNTSAKLTSKLMYGQSFRPPSFLESYPVVTGALANPNLAPEESETWDLAFSYAASKDLRLNLNLFYYQQDNMIGYDRLLNQYRNSGSHDIRGLELEAWWQIHDRLRLSGNYSRNHHSDEGNRFYSTPDQEAYLRLDWELAPRWQLNLQANWSDERERAPSDARADLDSHWLADATLRYSPDPHWELAVSLRNLFDQEARSYTGSGLIDDLPLAERSAFAELRYRF